MSAPAPPSRPPRPSEHDLRRLRGPLQARDREIVEHWRRASPAAHARAMIELSRYAARMAAQTGFGKDAEEMFPGFPDRVAHAPAAGKPG